MEKQAPVTFKTFWRSPRRVVYALAFFLIFGLTVAELGLTSEQLHKWGDDYDNYPTMEYKHDIGILLFSCVYTFLLLAMHIFVDGVAMVAFFTFIGAVFWGTGAGILYQVSPFRSYTCGNPAASFPANWAPYAGECARIVAMQGCAWANWGLMVLIFFGILIHKLEIHTRPNVTFYGP